MIILTIFLSVLTFKVNALTGQELYNFVNSGEFQQKIQVMLDKYYKEELIPKGITWKNSPSWVGLELRDKSIEFTKKELARMEAAGELPVSLIKNEVTKGLLKKIAGGTLFLVLTGYEITLEYKRDKATLEKCRQAKGKDADCKIPGSALLPSREEREAVENINRHRTGGNQTYD